MRNPRNPYEPINVNMDLPENVSIEFEMLRSGNGVLTYITEETISQFGVVMGRIVAQCHKGRGRYDIWTEWETVDPAPSLIQVISAMKKYHTWHTSVDWDAYYAEMEEDEIIDPDLSED